MNDTVTQLIWLADEYADAQGCSEDYDLATVLSKRQALQDELTLLFTPLTDGAVTTGYCFQPHKYEHVRVFMCGVRWAEREHGITGEKNEAA